MNKKPLVLLISLFLLLVPFLAFSGGQEEGSGIAKIVFHNDSNPKEDPTTKKLIAKFNQENPNIQAEFLVFEGGLADMEGKLLLTLSGGRSTPDIFINQYPSAATFYLSGWLEPVPEELRKWLVSNFSYTALEKPVTINNKMYAIPWSVGPFVMSYNPDYYAEAGIKQPPKTYDELMDYARKLTKYDSGGKVTRAGLYFRKTHHAHGIATKWSQFYFAWAGKKRFDPQGVYLDNDAARGALQYDLDAVYKYKVDSFDVEGDFSGLGKGTVAQLFRSPTVTSLIDVRYPDRKYNVAPLPRHKVAANYLGATGVLAVNKVSKHKEAVWTFIRWLYTERENWLEMSKAVSGDILKTVADDPFFQKSIFKVARQSVSNPDTLFHDPLMAGSYEGLMAMGRAIENVCYKKLTIDQGIAAMEKEILEVIEKHK